MNENLNQVLEQMTAVVNRLINNELSSDVKDEGYRIAARMLNDIANLRMYHRNHAYIESTQSIAQSCIHDTFAPLTRP
jgi:hypothetical protein